MYATLRQPRKVSEMSESALSTNHVTAKPDQARPLTKIAMANQGKYKSVSIFYGSNSGTCEALSNLLANDCAKCGIEVHPIRTLDSARDDFPPNGLVVIITATYDGRPTDNATDFVEWLNSLTGRPLEGVSYAVFGCGMLNQAKREYVADMI